MKASIYISVDPTIDILPGGTLAVLSKIYPVSRSIPSNT
ncbi:hypothetical protein BSPA14S_K0038 (plasmid) [Borreliella spielmanii A14S]|uniref:Uncharacterized protein n=1 Tax=Borreliella spielmanii A14S TaxID=498742 RepID=C0RBU8_9SPIR|nr:hypothetical protein BSPA14S_K0038 [Borreliella spielmanii A14S]